MNLRGIQLLPVAIAISAFLSASPPAVAEGIDKYEAREVSMLPRYCMYTQLFRSNVPGGDNEAEIKRWYTALGPTFNAMHHYCWGLMKTNRAMLAQAKHIRTHYLSSSIDEFNYVLNRAPPDFVLLPEILTKKGENLFRLGRAREGTAELIRAIDLKPDYWPPYAALSDYFKGFGNTATAREWLEKGLAKAPGTKALERRLATLKKAK